MTRLTKLILIVVRGLDPEPIPFPTQFCNMIYLQRFISRKNNFSGFFERKDLILSYAQSPFIGPIPIELTRLAQLERVNFSREPFLTGFIKEELVSFSSI